MGELPIGRGFALFSLHRHGGCQLDAEGIKETNWEAARRASRPYYFADNLIQNDMSKDNGKTRRVLGSPPRSPGGIVPAPERSTSAASDPGGFCQGLIAELPAGSMVEYATVRCDVQCVDGNGVPSASTTTVVSSVVTPPRRKDLRLCLERAKLVDSIAGVSTEGLSG